MDLTDFFINIFIILFLLFVNAFFVAAEFSLVKVRKTRLEQLCNEGNSNAKKALKLVNDVNRMLAAARGNNCKYRSRLGCRINYCSNY